MSCRDCAEIYQIHPRLVGVLLRKEVNVNRLLQVPDAAYQNCNFRFSKAHMHGMYSDGDTDKYSLLV